MILEWWKIVLLVMLAMFILWIIINLQICEDEL